MTDWERHLGPGRSDAQAATTDFNERTWLAWLIKVRIIIITFLLGIELAITSFTTTAVNKVAFVAVIVMCYTIAVFHAVVLSVWRGDLRVQPRIQVLADLGMATTLVYVTGGIDSSFNFLFPLIIIIGSILLSRSWAFLIAALAFIFQGAMLELSYFDVIKSYSLVRPDLKSLQAAIIINFFAYLAIAYLASRLSSRLRQVDVELKDKSGELEDLQALQENIVQSIGTGLITSGVDGSIRLVNPAAEQLLEKSASELIGQQVEKLFIDRLPEAGSSSAHAEVRITCNGRTRRQKTLGITASRLTTHSGMAGYIYTFDDLTEIRRLEREVRLRDRLSAVGRMAAGIAHEIRNPLSSIAGSVKVLSEVAALDDEQKILVDIVNRESERLNNIISDFLTYTREKQYEFARVDLVPLLEETLTLLDNRNHLGRPGEEPPQINIVRNIIPEHAYTVADVDRLKQVFWNICENAVRAMPDGGTFTVTLSAIGEDYWTISMADTGHGMKGSQIEKIFEPFQSEFSGGTGLGLAIVYQIIQAHDAKISVKSAPGEGADFIIRLKRCEAGNEQSSSEAPAIAVAAASGSGKVHHG